MADVKSTSDVHVSDEEYLHYFNNSFIHSGYFYSASSPPLKFTTTRRRSRHSTDTVPEFHAEAPHATVSDGLAQGEVPTLRIER